MKYFKEEEFLCKCGCGRGTFKDMHPMFLEMLDKARERAGIPFKITSGFRCLTYNVSIGGAKKSAHTKGYAVDIACHGSRNRFFMLKALLDAGFNRIGIGSNFIHVDCDPTLDTKVVWHYYGK